MAERRAELLCPAGDMERLEMALHYGADAVYLAGKDFGLRAAAGNFDHEQMAAAHEMCRQAGAKMYVAVNAIPHEGQMRALPDFLRSCADAGADGFIIADLGVLALAKKYAPDVGVHISTQMGVMNSETASMLWDMGAKRAILAREVSLDEAAEISAKAPRGLELEAFVHGAMCVSISGRCLLSDYMTGRGGNSGECAQPCRWKYALMEEKRPGQFFEITEDGGGSMILNSYDMCMIEHLGQLLDAGIYSLKIEGRMKSAYYAAVTANAYRHALDDALAGRGFDDVWLSECMKVSHRRYSTGFYYGYPGQYYPDAMYFSEAEVCAVVESCDADGSAVLTQRNKFSVGDTVELLTRRGKPLRFAVGEMRSAEGEIIQSAPHPMQELHLRLPVQAERLSILRRVKSGAKS